MQTDGTELAIKLQNLARAVVQAQEDNFVELIKIAQLDPIAGGLRFSNWSGISFDNCDLRKFDFTGCRLTGCSFRDALIEGACFAGADISGTNLRLARDWDDYYNTWRPSAVPVASRQLRTHATIQDAPFAPELAVIPVGKFLMGSPDGTGGDQGSDKEEGRTLDEGRRRIVEITSRFAIGRFAVTVGEFAEFVRRTNHEMPRTMTTYENRKNEERVRGWKSPGFAFNQTDMHPVVGVRWKDAVAYTNWLSNLIGQTYRLPSEAEWEYSARAGTQTAYWFGDEISHDYVNCDEDLSIGTVPVGRYEPNHWGLYQVHGNVWEWCDNRYMDVVPLNVPPRQYEDMLAQSMRGGSWRSEGRHCRSANRSRFSSHSNSIGFRVVRDVD